MLTQYAKGEIKLKKVISTLGLIGQADLRETMKTMLTPANEESTQLAKGAKTGTIGAKINNPTIDTGRLRMAVSWGAF